MVAGARQNFCELLDARARARALRMGDEQQGRPVGGRGERRLRRPGTGCGGACPRAVLVRPQHVEARDNTTQPDEKNDTPPDAAAGLTGVLWRRNSILREQYTTLRCNGCAIDTSKGRCS